MGAGDLLSGLAGPAAFGAAGWAITGLLPGLRRLRAGHRAGLAYLLGVAWTAGVLYALSHVVGLPLRRPVVVAVVAAPLLAMAVGARRRRTGTRPAPAGADRRRDLPALGVLLVAGLISSAVLAESLTAPLLDWDGRMTWAAQARWVRAAGTVDAPVLQEARWWVSHPRYPLLLPVAQVAALELVGAPIDSQAFRPLYALFFPALLLVLWGEARRRAGRRAALVAVLALAVAPFPAFDPNGGAAGAFSDLPLAAFWGAGTVLLLRPRPFARRFPVSDGVAAGLLLAAAVLSKTEGVVLAPAAVGLALATGSWRSRRGGRRAPARPPALAAGLAPVGWAALAVAAALALFVSWRSGIPNRFDEAYLERAVWRDLGPAAWAQLSEVAPILARKTFGVELWGLLFWAAPAVLAAGWRALRRRGGVPVLLAALAPPTLALAALASNPYRAGLAEVSWHRFLLQAALPGLLALALALRGLLPQRGFFAGAGRRRNTMSLPSS